MDALLIRKPKTVNTAQVVPCMYPPAFQEPQQPIWGRTVRLYRGAQDRWDPKKTAPVLLSPGRRRVFEDEVCEPNGTAGTSYVAYLEFVTMCWKAGWTPSQTMEVLNAGLAEGPCAQHRWQWARHDDLQAWFLDTWNHAAMTCPTTYFRRQVEAQTAIQGLLSNKGNETCREGLITFNPSTLLPGAQEPGEFVCYESKLEQVRLWLIDHPGQTQAQVKAGAPVASQSVMTYLLELEAQGRARWTPRPTGGRGRPAKVWEAVVTQEDRDHQAKEQERLDIFAKWWDEMSA